MKDLIKSNNLPTKWFKNGRAGVFIQSLPKPYHHHFSTCRPETRAQAYTLMTSECQIAPGSLLKSMALL